MAAPIAVVLGISAIRTTIGHKLGRGLTNPQILPVLDVMCGQVVRAIGGRREEYRPIVSRLTDSAQPLEVARALRARFGFSELYLADLDSIMGKSPAVTLYRALGEENFDLWVDLGLRDTADAQILDEAGVRTIVAGLETLNGPAALERLCREYGSERVVFSLDLKAGHGLGHGEAWKTNYPVEIARLAVTAGVRRIVVLDLAQVGTGTGTSTVELCGQLAVEFPNVTIAAGGGVGGIDDIRKLAARGVQTVLIASALHDDRMTW
jgi:phosphoribosylformimino-5-aminoimidazole carboxamide ribotide isomerase